MSLSSLTDSLLKLKQQKLWSAPGLKLYSLETSNSENIMGGNEDVKQNTEIKDTDLLSLRHLAKQSTFVLLSITCKLFPC